jgi:cystathionine gamma-synthase
VPHPEKVATADPTKVLPKISAVIYPTELWPTAKAFWQHTGEGVQSRRAEFCQKAFDEHFLVEKSSATIRVAKGPKRYQRNTSVDITPTNGPTNHNSSTNGDLTIDTAFEFVEARFGRNLDIAFSRSAKLAIRKRIAGSLQTTIDNPTATPSPMLRAEGLSEFSIEDVYLYPCGMNAIFHSHQILMVARGADTSIMYGFPYVDTLKVLEKFGPGALFYGYGNADDINALEKRLKRGERFMALYLEFPGNPLLRTPDLHRLRHLADEYNFAIVVDETIGNVLNVHLLPLADIIVSSLTKVFSGDSNVMGGALILNPRGAFYTQLKKVLEEQYEDNQFEEDSMYLERNSRDFVSRIARINSNAECIASILLASPKVKKVHYPKFSDTKEYYDTCRVPDGGYGGLLSAIFWNVEDAEVFFDALETAKGPSLGTNFTLSSPFVLLAHFGELEWAKQYGCPVELVRFSVGLEEEGELRRVFERALEAVPEREGVDGDS